MDGLIFCRQTYRKRISQSRIPRIDLTAPLRDDQTISSVGTATVIPTGLTITGEATNGALLKVDGKNVAVGKAITFTASGGSIPAGETSQEYQVVIPFTASDGEQLSVEGVRIIVLPNLS